MMRTRFDGSVVIVEGVKDIRVYQRFIDSDHCKLIPGYGKEKTLGALKALEELGEVGVLALVDSDFDRLLERPAGPSVVRTDGHDLEAQMFGSPALDKVLAEYGSAGKLTDKDARTIVLRSAEVLGCLRFISQRDGLDLTFEGMTFSRFVDRLSLTVDRRELLLEVGRRSQRPDLHRVGLERQIDDVLGRHNLLEVCCGHDAVEILGIAFRRLFGSCTTAESAPEALERSLRLAYEHAHFSLTGTYRALRDWENRNELYKVLP
jgi:hypothetical protein